MDVPQLFASLLSTGRIVDIALAFIGVEFFILLLGVPVGQRGARVIALIPALGPGICLMIALRCALVGTAPFWIALWLSASLPLHLWDIKRRKF
jgi:hypothetical protein